MARETARFHYREGEAAPQIALPLPAQVKDQAYGLGKTEVNAWLDRVTEIDAAFAAAVTRRGGLVLTYEEDLQADPGVGYRRVLEHLGLPLAGSEPLYAKADRRPLKERLSNFTELEAMLRPAHHRRYCGEDPGSRAPQG